MYQWCGSKTKQYGSLIAFYLCVRHGHHERFCRRTLTQDKLSNSLSDRRHEDIPRTWRSEHPATVTQQLEYEPQAKSVQNLHKQSKHQKGNNKELDLQGGLSLDACEKCLQPDPYSGVP